METNKDERMEQYRRERLAEYGLTEETAAQIKALLEANNYRVDDSYFFNVSYIYTNWDDQPKASLTFTNGLFYMSNSSSHWDLETTKQILEQTKKCVELMEAIKAIAPTVVDPTYRDQKHKAAEEAAKEHTKELIKQWNALPEVETVLELSNGVKLTKHRGKAEYRSNYSESYNRQFWLGFKLGDRDFWPHSYLTKSNSVLKKKFAEYHDSLPAGDVEKILAVLQKLDRMKSDAHCGRIV